MLSARNVRNKEVRGIMVKSSLASSHTRVKSLGVT